MVISASGLLPSLASAIQEKASLPLGVALFTLPKALSEDFEGTLKRISEIGYKEVEFFGPYPYSGEQANENWKRSAGFLGFSGSGYFGRSAKEVRAILDRHKLTAPSIHVELETLMNNMEGIAKYAHIIGHRYVGIASLPEYLRSDLDGYKKAAELFNEIGRSAKNHGLTFFYHNHGYGHQAMDGIVPFQYVLDHTDPELVKMEMDVFWFTAAGINPVKYLKENPGRFKLLHLKDMKELRTFPGDGGSMQEWMAMFPYLTDAGEGVIDLKAILSEARKNGAEHFFLEKDLTPNHEEALQKSFGYLSGLSF